MFSEVNCTFAPITLESNVWVGSILERRPCFGPNTTFKRKSVAGFTCRLEHLRATQHWLAASDSGRAPVPVPLLGNH